MKHYLVTNKHFDPEKKMSTKKKSNNNFLEDLKGHLGSRAVAQLLFSFLIDRSLEFRFWKLKVFQILFGARKEEDDEKRSIKTYERRNTESEMIIFIT